VIFFLLLFFSSEVGRQKFHFVPLRLSDQSWNFAHFPLTKIRPSSPLGTFRISVSLFDGCNNVWDMDADRLIGGLAPPPFISFNQYFAKRLLYYLPSAFVLRVPPSPPIFSSDGIG